jgi:hypothetical protein
MYSIQPKGIFQGYSTLGFFIQIVKNVYFATWGPQLATPENRFSETLNKVILSNPRVQYFTLGGMKLLILSRVVHF